MEILIDLSDDEVQAILKTIHRYKSLSQQEEATGIAPSEIFDIEVEMGNYQWLLERIDSNIK